MLGQEAWRCQLLSSCTNLSKVRGHMLSSSLSCRLEPGPMPGFRMNMLPAQQTRMASSDQQCLQ